MNQLRHSRARTSSVDLAGVGPRGLTIALGETHELVAMGLRQMLAPYEPALTVLSHARRPQAGPADLVLVDPCVGRTDQVSAAEVIAGLSLGRQLVIYTWGPSSGPGGLPRLRTAGWPIRGWLSKTLPADQLVRALVRIHAGQVVVVDEAPSRGVALRAVSTSRPTAWRLSDRESDVIAMIGQGMSNQDIADALFLSINTVKSYIRSSYRKIGVTNRSQAVLWSVRNGVDMVPWQIVHGLPSIGLRDAAIARACPA